MSHSRYCPDRYTVRREAERDAERRSYADRNKYGDCYDAQREYERAFEHHKYEQRREQQRREEMIEQERQERRREEYLLEEAREDYYRHMEYEREQDETENLICESLPALCNWMIAPK